MRKFNDQELAKRDKLKKLQDSNNDPFHITKFVRNFNSQTFKLKFSEFTKEQLHEDKTKILIAGRIMSIRQTFGVIKDFYGTIQFYINKKNVEQTCFEIFKNDIDLGDIVGLEGTPMKTNTGELTINVNKITLLSKSLKPLPEKWHGLQDEELRARKRYVDLIMNQDSFSTFILRSKIIKSIRDYMDERNYLEVETPILQPRLGGASARPFITKHNTLDRNYFLRIATELPLKKLIVGGFDKVYEIGRIFRNEGMDATHNPEFTTLEAYEAYSDIHDMMTLTEGVIKYIAKQLNLNKLNYKNVDIDFSKDFEKYSMIELIKKHASVDFNLLKTDEEAIKIAKQHNIELLAHQNTWGHVVNLFFEHYVEKHLLQPTFVFDFPIDVSPLAKKNKNNPRLTERFELFICAKEIANAFSELNDPIDQYERFERQLKERDLGNSEANEMDEEYIDALEYGLPPTGGVGIGIDRLIMLFTAQETIRNVLLFPHMREENK